MLLALSTGLGSIGIGICGSATGAMADDDDNGIGSCKGVCKGICDVMIFVFELFIMFVLLFVMFVLLLFSDVIVGV